MSTQNENTLKRNTELLLTQVLYYQHCKQWNKTYFIYYKITTTYQNVGRMLELAETIVHEETPKY